MSENRAFIPRLVRQGKANCYHFAIVDKYPRRIVG